MENEPFLPSAAERPAQTPQNIPPAPVPPAREAPGAPGMPPAGEAPGAPAWGYPPVWYYPPQAFYVQPLSPDGLSPEGAGSAAASPGGAGSAAAPYKFVPTYFETLFGRWRPLTVFTVLTAAGSFAWLITYVITVLVRGAMFTEAARAVSFGPEVTYTLYFSSPVLTVLRVSLCLLAAFAVGWGVCVKLAEKKKRLPLKRRLFFAVVGLLLAVAVAAAADLAAVHLLF